MDSRASNRTGRTSASSVEPRSPGHFILSLTLAAVIVTACGCDQFHPLALNWGAPSGSPKPVTDVSPTITSPKAAPADPDSPDALAKQAEANAQRIEQGLTSAKSGRRLNDHSAKLIMPNPQAGPLEPANGTLDPAAASADAAAPGSTLVGRPPVRSGHTTPARTDKPVNLASGPPPAVTNLPGNKSMLAESGPPVVLVAGPVIGSGGSLSASIPASTGSPAGSANSPAAIPSNATGSTNPPAGSALSTAPPARPISGSLTDAIAQTEKLAAGQPNDFRAQWQLRLLYLAAGRTHDAQAPWAGGSASDQKTLSAWVEAAIALEAARTPNSSATDPHDAAITALDQLRQHEADQAALKVRTVKLATRVDGFGILTPLDTDGLRPGQWVIVYSELDNLTSKLQSDNLYRCELALRIELLSSEGKSLSCQEDKQVIDRSLNPRRDFFLARRMCLPADMPPGQYVLRVSVEDRQANKVGESMLRFGIK